MITSLLPSVDSIVIKFSPVCIETTLRIGHACMHGLYYNYTKQCACTLIQVAIYSYIATYVVVVASYIDFRMALILLNTAKNMHGVVLDTAKWQSHFYFG